MQFNLEFVVLFIGFLLIYFMVMHDEVVNYIKNGSKKEKITSIIFLTLWFIFLLLCLYGIFFFNIDSRINTLI